MTQPGHEPSKDWLAFVKTSRARNKIKHLINASERVKAIEIGQKYLEKEARRLGVQLGKVTKADMERVAGGVRATARWKTCTRRSATASFRRARCSPKSRPAWSRKSRRSRKPASTPDSAAPYTAPGTPARRWRRRHQSPRAWTT